MKPLITFFLPLCNIPTFKLLAQSILIAFEIILNRAFNPVSVITLSLGEVEQRKLVAN